jgi:hypothetical protein
MKHRKCDQKKYKKRVARQNVNSAERKERLLIEERLRADRALAARIEADRRHREDPRTQLAQRLVNVLQAKVNRDPLYQLVYITGWLAKESGTPLLMPHVVVNSPPPPKRLGPVCRLCNQLVTQQDRQGHNVKQIELNNHWYPVHKTCPMEVKLLNGRS